MAGSAEPPDGRSYVWDEYRSRRREQERREMRRRAQPLNPEDLAKLTRHMVDYDSWSYPDGSPDGMGAMTVVGNTLVIRHAPKYHKAVAGLLAMLRAHYASRRKVTIEARWVVADPPVLPKAAKGGPVPTEVDLEALTRAGAKTLHYGRLTGLDGQRLHLASARAQTLVTDHIPVVSGSAAASRAVPKLIQWGPVLEVSASLAADGATVMLDVACVVTRLREIRTKPVQVDILRADGRPLRPPQTIDLLDCDVQAKFCTTLTAPVGKAVVVGGTTMPASKVAGAKADTAAKAMYLILKVTVPKAAAAPAAKPKPARKATKRSERG